MVPTADFVLIGHDSPYKRWVARTATGAGHGNVHVLAYVRLDELWELTCGADVGFVLTQPVSLSYRLSEGNKPYEYMAAGIPIVASTIASHCQLADQTGAILLVDPYDPADIARAANELVKDLGKRKALGARGRAWAERKYNAAAEMHKLRVAYDRLAHRLNR